MKRITFWCTAFLVLLASVGHADAAPQNGRGDRVCFYKDIRFQGWEQCYGPGDEVANLGNRKNAISSMRVYGRVHVTVFDDTEFRGNAAEFDSDVPDMGLRIISGSKSWSDRIQSVRVSAAFAPPPPPPPPNRGPLLEVREGICVYDQVNFRGRSECWEAGRDIEDLARVGNWNDRIRSIRVFGRAHVILYRDIRFNGERLVIDQDLRDLSQIRVRGGRTWADQISSIVVENERGRRGRGPR